MFQSYKNNGDNEHIVKKCVYKYNLMPIIRLHRLHRLQGLHISFSHLSID